MSFTICPRHCSDNAYIKSPGEPQGVTAIWSEERNRREVDGLMANRTVSSTKWVAELLRRGACIYQSANINCLNAVEGDILVTNPELLPQEELEKIRAYKKGEVIYLSAPTEGDDYRTQPNPLGMGFPYPLFFTEIEEKLLTDCVARINKGLAFVSSYSEECHVQEIRTGSNTSRFVIDNEEYYYTSPVVRTGCPILSAIDLTKSRGYVVRVNEDAFRVLVPLRGAAIVEVQFKDYEHMSS